MDQTEPRIVVVDIGYGFTKGLSPGKSPFICPSLVAPARSIRFKSDLGDSGGITVAVNGSRYFVGKLAELQGRGGAQTMSTDRVDSDELLALFYAACSDLVTVASERVQIVTGLPVADYDDANKARLEKALMGPHIVNRDGRSARKFVVEQVAIVPQAVGTLFGMVLDKDGQVTQNDDLQQGRVAVIDVGQFTTNFVTLDRLRYVDHLSMSQETGVSRVLSDLQRDLRERHGLNLEKLSQADRAVRDGFVHVMGEPVGIADLIERHVTQLGDMVMSQASSLWANGVDLAAVVLTGGGAALLAERVSGVYSHTRIVADAQFSNAQGYLRLAMRRARKGG